MKTLLRNKIVLVVLGCFALVLAFKLFVVLKEPPQHVQPVRGHFRRFPEIGMFLISPGDYWRFCASPAFTCAPF